MLDRVTPGFSSEFFERAADSYDLHSRETRPLFAALSAISFLGKVEQEAPDDLETCESIWDQACIENTLFVGEKGETLITFILGAEKCLILSCVLDSFDTKWELITDGYASMGNMAVFLMGHFKEQGIIRRYQRIDPSQCNELYRTLKTAASRQNKSGIRVFSYENWKLIYGNYPFNHSLLIRLKYCDGEQVVQSGNSIGGNPQYMLQSRSPMTNFSIISTRLEEEDDLKNEDIKSNNELASLVVATQLEIILPIPSSFETPALLMTEDAVAFAMVSPSNKKQGFFTVKSEPQFPYGQFLPALFDEVDKDRRLFANGCIDTDDSVQVFILNLDQIQRYANVLISHSRRFKQAIDEANADRYFSSLIGYTDEYEMKKAQRQYETECLSILNAIGYEEYAIQHDIEVRHQAEERKHIEELHRLEEEKRRQETLKRQEEERQRLAAQQKTQSSSLHLVKTFHTKLAGVTYSNSGSNTESRQKIIRQLSRNGQLEKGQELRLVQEPSNPYDDHAVAVFGPDGRQLGYLGKDVARTVFNEMDQGVVYKIYVSEITGGSIDMSYGVNVKIESYISDSSSPSSRPTYSPYSRPNSYGGELDYSDLGIESIYDVARGEGFSIDDDGHWVPLDDDY